MPSLREAERRTNLRYLSLVHANSLDFGKLDLEFRQIQQVCSRLVRENDWHFSLSFLQLVYDLAPYLQRSALNKTLLEYCQSGLQIAGQAGENLGRLLLLQYQAYWALGAWDAGASSLRAAITASKSRDDRVYAQSHLALGQLQLNRGDYAVALETLAQAERLLAEISDDEGIASVKAEIAAYHLNRLEYGQALELYLDVDSLRRRIHDGRPSAHTLLMLGVIYRRLKKYDEAEIYLTELVLLSTDEGNQGSLATALHHLGWVYFELGDLERAAKLARTVKSVYEKIGDPRGESDVDEQLGMIAMSRRDWDSAQSFLERSLETRQQFGNQHGAASAQRRLAKLFLKQGKWWIGLAYLFRCLALYARLGALSRQRLFAIILDLPD